MPRSTTEVYTQATQISAKHSYTFPLESPGRRIPLGLSTSTHHIAHVDHDESIGAQDCHQPI